MNRSPARSSRLAPVAALGATALAALALVAGCSSGDSDDRASRASTSAVDAGGSVRAPAEVDGVSGAKVAADGSARNASADGADVQERALIAKAALELSTKQVDDVRRRAIDVATAANGVVANEETDSDDRGRAESVHLVVRVPVDRFDRVLDALARLGRLEHRSQSTQDVTTQAIDLAARVRAQRASVESIERLYAKARTIGEVMSIENQLAKRQATLDSLERQQKYLADQTAQATISVTITRSHAPATHAAKAGPGGFLGGLEDGWHALATVGTGLAVTAGALLPFAILLAVLGVPAWLVVRHRRRPGPAEPTST